MIGILVVTVIVLVLVGVWQERTIYRMREDATRLQKQVTDAQAGWREALARSQHYAAYASDLHAANTELSRLLMGTTNDDVTRTDWRH